MRATWIVLALFALALVLGCAKAPPKKTEVLLGVAASFRHATPVLIAAYAADHPDVAIVATYGGSGDLKRQVDGGAPIDGVIFASGKPVDELVAAGRVEAASRRVIATNKLVLIGPRGARPITFSTLEMLPAGEKLAIGDPASVPAGQYAREYLQALGKWRALQGSLVFGGDVSAVLAYARRGEVAAAIVYRTEIRGIDDVIVLDEAKGEGAPHPEVVCAAVRGARASTEAAAFLAFAGSAEGTRILADFGFGPP